MNRRHDRFSTGMTDISTPPSTEPTDGGDGPPDPPGGSTNPATTLLRRITRLEIVVGAVIAAVMLVLVALEPDIVEAPFENERTLLFTIGGTIIAAIAFVVMLALRVPSIVRVIVLVVPFAIVNWWLISPYFIDDVVDEAFTTSIADQQPAADADGASTGEIVIEAPADDGAPVDEAAPAEQAPTGDSGSESTSEEAGDDTVEDATVDAEPAPPSGDSEGSTDDATAEAEPVAEPAPAEETPAPPPAPTEPVLLGAGQFVGLAGHDGTGDAGIFQNPDGSLVLRFENFDIENGPDLEVYLVPGADQTSLAEGSVHLGALKGNIGNQNYDLASGTQLAPGAYTALVWCEAFSVEFVGATIIV